MKIAPPLYHAKTSSARVVSTIKRDRRTQNKTLATPVSGLASGEGFVRDV